MLPVLGKGLRVMPCFISAYFRTRNRCEHLIYITVENVDVQITKRQYIFVLFFSQIPLKTKDIKPIIVVTLDEINEELRSMF